MFRLLFFPAQSSYTTYFFVEGKDADPPFKLDLSRRMELWRHTVCYIFHVCYISHPWTGHCCINVLFDSKGKTSWSDHVGGLQNGMHVLTRMPLMLGVLGVWTSKRGLVMTHWVGNNPQNPSPKAMAAIDNPPLMAAQQSSMCALQLGDRN